MNGNGPEDPMAKRRSDHDVGPILETWMATVAPQRPPDRLLEESFARTMVAGQLRVYPWHALRGAGRGRSAGARMAGLALTAVAVVLAIAVVTSLILRPGRGTVGGEPSPAGASPSPVVSASPSASAVPFPSPILVEPTVVIPITGPVSLATDGTSVWSYTAAGDVVRIDPLTNKIVATARPAPETNDLQSLAGNESGLWVTDWTASKLFRLDPQTLRAVTSIGTAGQSKGVLITRDAVWVANTRGGSVERIDPKTTTVISRIPLGPIGPSGPNWLAEGLGSLWVGVPNNSTVFRIDQATNRVQAAITVDPPASPCGGLAVGSTAVWVSSCDGSSFVAQIDPVTNVVVATIDLRGKGYTFAMIGDRPWVASTNDQIVRLDPISHAVDRVVTPGPGFSGGGDVVVAAGSLWIVDFSANRILRLPLASFRG
jgi:glutamine cyclotransferase